MSTLNLHPMARAALSEDEAVAIEIRARALGVRVGAMRNIRRHWWHVTVASDARRVALRGAGPLAAVIEGCIQDYEAAA